MEKVGEKEEKYILLEISGENGDFEQYKRNLCEASLLGISRVVFGGIWGNNEERGQEILGQLLSVCAILNMEPWSMTICYEGVMFNYAAIGKMRESKGMMTPEFINLIPIDEYKTSRGIVLEEEQVKKILTMVI